MSSLWAGKHSTSLIALFHCSPQHWRDGKSATLKRNNSAFRTAHCRCLTPYSPASQPLTLVGVKPASFRDDILLPFFMEKNQRKLINFVVLVFVKNKLLLISFSANFILSNNHHTFLTNNE